MVKRINIIAIILMAAAFAIYAQSIFGGGAKEHLKFKTYTTNSSPKQGDEFKVKLNIKIAEHWYTYSTKRQTTADGYGPEPLDISVAPKSDVELSGKLTVPKTKKKFDQGFQMDVEYYKGSVDFILPLKAKKDLDLNKKSFDIVLYIQICDTTACLPPEEIKVKVSPELFAFEGDSAATANDTLAEAAATGEKKDNKPQTTESQEEISKKKSEGILSFLWFAMGMGALALLTPCVFPMIPITVSFFTKRAEKTKARGILDASVYGLGIIATFTAIGFILAIFFGATAIRDFAANGWVNMAIAAIFIIFALNLFGAFEIQVPTGLLNKLNRSSQGSGIVSVLLMGLTFSLTSFTCTVPFVGSALISASGGEWFYPIVGMVGFSAVFAAPFFLLALFPSFMKKLPKSGGWMNNVKVVMGFLEIAAAIKFISNADLVWAWGIMPREFFLAIWISCGMLIVVYVLGFFKLHSDTPVEKVGAVRTLFAIFFFSVTIYLITGLFGKALGELDSFLPPPDYEEIQGGAAGSEASIGGLGGGISMMDKAKTGWIKDYNEGLELAKKENKPVFIDFTGFTCTNCRWMETNMFPKPEVYSRMEKMVRVKLFTDRREEPYLSNKALQQDRFGSIELPLYVILNPDGSQVATKSFTRDEQEFLDFLDKGL